MTATRSSTTSSREWLLPTRHLRSRKQSPSVDQRAEARSDAAPASPAPEIALSPDTPEEPSPALTGLDALLEGLPPMSAPNGNATPATGSQPEVADDSRSETSPNRSADTR